MCYPIPTPPTVLGMKLPKPKIYPLTPKEMKDLRESIDKNSALGPEPGVESLREQAANTQPNTTLWQKEPRVPGVPEAYADLADIFSEEECNSLPPHRPTDCALELVPGAKLDKPRMYAMTPKEVEELHRYIDSNLARGFIMPSQAHMAAPVLFREKKDSGLCLCVDFHGLNGVSVEPLYPLPVIKDLLATLSTGQIFTKLDLREEYYRIRIKAGEEWKTTFNCSLGSYKFQVMPFGLLGAPAVFMQPINEVLHEYLYRGALVYLDNILIYTNTMEEHVLLVHKGLEKLLAAKLFVKVSKCEFHRTELDYLGYRISKKRLRMNPKKVAAIMEWQTLETRKQVQSFLSFANFYCQLIPAFAHIALPLTDLLHTKGSVTPVKPRQCIIWTTECQKAFDTLKTLFAQEPILQHPNQNKPFIVQTDAMTWLLGLSCCNLTNLQPLATLYIYVKEIHSCQTGVGYLGEGGVRCKVGATDLAVHIGGS